jgi:PHD/YefM family antitoxin component YafN of YafNO toxin-antitoxin module
MAQINATTTELRQNLHQHLAWVAAGAGQIHVLRHDRVAAVLISTADFERLQRLEGERSEWLKAKQQKALEEYGPEVDARIWDPKIRELMGLPPRA